MQTWCYLEGAEHVQRGNICISPVLAKRAGGIKSSFFLLGRGMQIFPLCGACVKTVARAEGPVGYATTAFGNACQGSLLDM